MALSTNFRASAFMALAMSGFVINDVITKTLTHEINVAQVMFTRGLILVVLLAVLLKWENKPIHMAQLKSWPLILRVLLEAAATVTFITGFSQLPVANGSAIMQALPLVVTLGAIFFLKEPVGWRRISAILVGFVGVLIVMRPGPDGFNIYALLLLCAVFFAGARDLATRKLDHNISSLLVSLVTASTVTVLGLVLIIPYGGWQPISPMMIIQLVFAACFLLIGYQFNVLAMRSGDVATVAPFRYTSLLWAIVLGYFIFGTLPDIWTFVGAAIIVGSGLYTLLREHQRSRSLQVATESAATMPGARGT